MFVENYTLRIAFFKSEVETGGPKITIGARLPDPKVDDVPLCGKLSSIPWIFQRLCRTEHSMLCPRESNDSAN